jgi:hypothetical protein
LLLSSNEFLYPLQSVESEEIVRLKAIIKHLKKRAGEGGEEDGGDEAAETEK